MKSQMCLKLIKVAPGVKVFAVIHQIQEPGNESVLSIDSLILEHFKRDYKLILSLLSSWPFLFCNLTVFFSVTVNQFFSIILGIHLPNMT